MADAMDDLDRLCAAVEADADWPPIDPLLERMGLGEGHQLLRAYNGSLDAAKALHDELLPGYGWGAGPWGTRVWLYSDRPEWDGSVRQEVDMIDAPARAWLLAILRACRTAEGGGA